MAHEFVVHLVPSWGKWDKDVAGKDEYYLLRLPTYGEPGFYRQTVSFDAFFNSFTAKISRVFKKKGSAAADKLRPNHRDDYFYYAAHLEEWERRQDLLITTLNKSKQSHTYKKPTFTKVFDSIWDFYTYIGYDYKSKRYIQKATS